MAQASGLTLVPEQLRDPSVTTTYGTGQLLLAALEAGYRTIVVAVGGSATNDGGTGAAQALGVRLTDASGNDIPLNAGGLRTLAHADLAHRHPAVSGAILQVATDVSNPLTGPTGAAFTTPPRREPRPRSCRCSMPHSTTWPTS
jgi:glycerate kinase